MAKINDNTQNAKHTLATVRILSVVVYGTILLKITSYLRLIESFSYLIDIIYQILIDIQSFIIIMVGMIIICAFSFYTIAKNQSSLDELNDTEKENVPYHTFTGAIWYVWVLVLGEYEYESFQYGKGSQKFILQFLFCVTAFVIQIHLLNMLIAIMGNTFAERKEIVRQIKIRFKLLFIVENWYLVSWALRDSEKMKYIITASLSKTQDEDQQMMQFLRNKMYDIKLSQKND